MARRLVTLRKRKVLRCILYIVQEREGLYNIIGSIQKNNSSRHDAIHCKAEKLSYKGWLRDRARG